VTAIKRSAIVKEALSWEGTPWHHHQGVKGAGVDCVQFLLKVGQAVDAIPTDILVENYEPLARGSFLVRHLNQWLEPLQQGATIFPGDVMLFGVGGLDTHVGIVIDDYQFIHACARRKRVIRCRVDRFCGEVKRYYQVPGVIDG
jgi:cell wall-associated NlpC family hydrolase